MDIPQFINWENPSELKDLNVFDDKFEFEEAIERKSGNVYRWNKYDWILEETMQDLVKWRVVKESINILTLLNPLFFLKNKMNCNQNPIYYMR